MTLQRALGSSHFYLRFHKCTSLRVNEAIGSYNRADATGRSDRNTQAVDGRLQVVGLHESGKALLWLHML